MVDAQADGSAPPSDAVVDAASRKVQQTSRDADMKVFEDRDVHMSLRPVERDWDAWMTLHKTRYAIMWLQVAVMSTLTIATAARSMNASEYRRRLQS